MGRGDKKTKRGKIVNGTYGVRRPRVKKSRSIEIKPKAKAKSKTKAKA